MVTWLGEGHELDLVRARQASPSEHTIRAHSAGGRFRPLLYRSVALISKSWVRVSISAFEIGQDSAWPPPNGWTGNFQHSLAPWDTASGLLLAREADGQVVDRQGQRAGLFMPSVIAFSPVLIQRFLQATEGHPWREG